MKFSNIKNKVTLTIVTLLSIAGTLSHASEKKRLECGEKVGVMLAHCLFKHDDNLTFLDYIEKWRRIIQEYQPHFDSKIVATAIKALNDIETYVKAQYAQGKLVNPTKVAIALSQLVDYLPADVKKQYRTTFEQLQLKFLKRNKPLSSFELVGPLSKRLNDLTKK